MDGNDFTCGLFVPIPFQMVGMIQISSLFELIVETCPPFDGTFGFLELESVLATSELFHLRKLVIVSRMNTGWNDLQFIYSKIVHSV